jgi:hypothetical protein
VGVETALLVGGGIAAVTGAAGDIMAGYAAKEEAEAAAELERLNATVARQEAKERARVRTEELTSLKETQKLAMIKSGMGLAGSPLLILEDTKRQLSNELNQLRTRSALEQKASGLRQRSLLKSGRMAMMGGYAKGLGRVASFGASAMSPSPGSPKPKPKPESTLVNGGYTGTLGGMA